MQHCLFLFLKFINYKEYSTLVPFVISLCIDKLWKFNNTCTIESNMDVLNLSDEQLFEECKDLL